MARIAPYRRRHFAFWFHFTSLHFGSWIIKRRSNSQKEINFHKRDWWKPTRRANKFTWQVKNHRHTSPRQRQPEVNLILSSRTRKLFRAAESTEHVSSLFITLMFRNIIIKIHQLFNGNGEAANDFKSTEIAQHQNHHQAVIYSSQSSSRFKLMTNCELVHTSCHRPEPFYSNEVFCATTMTTTRTFGEKWRKAWNKRLFLRLLKTVKIKEIMFRKSPFSVDSEVEQFPCEKVGSKCRTGETSPCYTITRFMCI